MIPHQQIDVLFGNQPWEVFTYIKTHSGAKRKSGARFPYVPSCLDWVQDVEVAHIFGVETWLVYIIKLLSKKKFSFEQAQRLSYSTLISLGEAEREINES